MVPAFTPYLEIPRLDRYDLDVIELHASAVDDDGDPTWQFPDAEIDKLADPAVKALFVVNPSNPPSVMLAPATLERITDIVQTSNPGLIIVTDDVYGTFVPGFRSLMDVLPGEHDRHLLVLEVLRGDRLAARRGRALPRQRARPAHRRAAARRAREILDRRYESISTTTRATSASSTGWSPTAGRSRSTTPPVSRSRSRCR